MSVAVGVMARAPSSGGKTRLSPHHSPARLDALRAALLADTLHALGRLPNVTIFFTPDDAEQEIASMCGTAIPRVPQGEGDLGARMHRALQRLLAPRGLGLADSCGAGLVDSRGAGLVDSCGPGLQACDAAILIGSDIPLLTADHIHEAAAFLTRSATALAERPPDRSIVLGPADDGGYYLVGMTEPHPELFEGIGWGTESVLTDTLRAADRAGLAAHLVRSAYDVDRVEDLLRLERDLKWAPSVVCPAIRRWLAAD